MSGKDFQRTLPLREPSKSIMRIILTVKSSCDGLAYIRFLMYRAPIYLIISFLTWSYSPNCKLLIANMFCKVPRLYNLRRSYGRIGRKVTWSCALILSHKEVHEYKNNQREVLLCNYGWQLIIS